MWMTIISFIGGPVIKGLIDGYKAKLAAGNTSEKIASETASAEIAAQVAESNAIMQYRIAEIGHWYARQADGLLRREADSRYRSGRSPDWLKVKNPESPAMHPGKGCAFLTGQAVRHSRQNPPKAPP
jgi:hypothetical protein